MKHVLIILAVFLAFSCTDENKSTPPPADGDGAERDGAEIDRDPDPAPDGDVDRDLDPEQERDGDMVSDPDTDPEPDATEQEEGPFVCSGDYCYPEFGLTYLGWPRAEEPFFGDCVPGAIKCSEDLREGYVCDANGQWLLWATYREPVICADCNKTLLDPFANLCDPCEWREEVGLRTFPCTWIKKQDAMDPSENEWQKFRDADGKRPVAAIDTRPSDHLFCNLCEDIRTIDSASCIDGEETDYLTANWALNCTSSGVGICECDGNETHCNSPYYRIPLPITCGGKCQRSNDVSIVHEKYTELLNKDMDLAHCEGEPPLMSFNPDLPDYLKNLYYCGGTGCAAYSMRCYHGICVPLESEYCQRPDDDCGAGKHCREGRCVAVTDGDIERDLALKRFEENLR